jgi:hypothetical protein
MGIPGINIDDDSSGLSRIIVAPFVDLGDAALFRSSSSTTWCRAP